MKATFPTGESKNPRSLDPEHPSACIRAAALPNWSKTAASISGWRQREGRESNNGNEREREGERKTRSARFYFCLSQVVSQLEWRQRSKGELCWKACARKLFHNLGTERAAESQWFLCVCACVRVIMKHWAIITASLWLPRRARHTSPHCNILCWFVFSSYLFWLVPLVLSL